MAREHCQNCGHEWHYTGQKSAGEPVTCPNCTYKVWLSGGKDA